jgi:hypothetical protein
MVERIEDLHSNQGQMTRKELIEALSKWDLDQARAIKIAESRLRVCPKKCAWSPALRNAAIVCKY